MTIFYLNDNETPEVLGGRVRRRTQRTQAVSRTDSNIGVSNIGLAEQSKKVNKNIQIKTNEEKVENKKPNEQALQVPINSNKKDHLIDIKKKQDEEKQINDFPSLKTNHDVSKANTSSWIKKSNHNHQKLNNNQHDFPSLPTNVKTSNNKLNNHIGWKSKNIDIEFNYKKKNQNRNERRTRIRAEKRLQQQQQQQAKQQVTSKSSNEWQQVKKFSIHQIKKCPPHLIHNINQQIMNQANVLVLNIKKFQQICKSYVESTCTYLEFWFQFIPILKLQN